MAEYLGKVVDVLGLPGILGQSGEFEGVPLVWLPLAPDTDESTDISASFWLTRRDDPFAQSNPIDRTVVFLVAETAAAAKPDTVLGSRRGIRVVAHVSKSAQSMEMQIRITGVARSIDL